MKNGIVLTVMLLFIVLGLPQLVYGSNERSIERYVEYFHQTVKPKYARQAKILIPSLIQYAEKYEVDPLEVACLFSFESSWRNFKGDLGERGPGHVMPGKFTRGFDLDTLDGQIEASVARWALAWDKCQTFERALTHYACGACVSESEKTKSKIKYRKRYILRMKKKFK